MNTKNVAVWLGLFAAVLFLNSCAGLGGSALSKSSQEDLMKRGRASLNHLYDTSPKARELRPQVKSILVFPDIIKAGLFVGGSGGNGVMFSPNGRVLGYYNITGLSYGLQLGAENYSQAMFLVTDEAVQYLNDSAGWSIGTGPHVVVVDEGMGKDLSSTTLRPDVFSFVYGQKGLMGALAIQGQKITKLEHAK
ncbi:MAG: YSC84-related protein [Deltaproteobacteria bacterium]|nr:YSC84-related protein [Deltaproteobacteria bacterium]